VQRALYEERAKPGGIYEEISFDQLVSMGSQRSDEAGFRVLRDLGHLALDTPHAFGFAAPP
jgi:hypothetical protein